MEDYGVLKNKSTIFGSKKEEKDFDEEDVWNVANESDDYGLKFKRVCKDSSVSSSAWTLPRKIPKTNTLPVKGSSAPMNIPDWSKVYGKNFKNGGDYDDEDDADMVPPHEWIAKKLARSQISSFSVCEGIGRTLKGRDLSKVRNAILAKTGFIE